MGLKQKIILILFGVFLALVLIEGALRLAGYLYAVSDSLKDRRTKQDIFYPRVVRILCLGACYTVGIGVSPENTYPRSLERILNEHYPGLNFVVINGGERARNLPFFVTRLKKYLDQYRPHIIIFNINSRLNRAQINPAGINDNFFSFPGRMKFYTVMALEKLKIYRLVTLAFDEKTAHVKTSSGGVPSKEIPGRDNKYVEKIQELKEKLKANPQDGKTWGRLGKDYSKLDLFDLAIESTKKAIEIIPDDGSYYLDLFWDYVLLKDYRLAVEMREKAFLVDPGLQNRILKEIAHIQRSRPNKTPSFKFALSDKFASLGRYKEALEICTQALEEEPTDLEYYNKAAFYRYILGENDGDLKDMNNTEAKQWESFLSFYYNCRAYSAFWSTIGTSRRSKTPAAADPNGLGEDDKFLILLRYYFNKAKTIICEYGDIPIMIENLGSCYRQQAVIRRACKEFNIPVKDIWEALMSASDKKHLFHPYLPLRFSAEGNEFIAREIFTTLAQSGILDKVKQ